jgi:hypothetical protein
MNDDDALSGLPPDPETLSEVRDDAADDVASDGEPQALPEEALADSGKKDTGGSPPSRVGKSQKAPGAQAADLIVAPLRRKEGIRHLWLGDSGQGKTWANRILISGILRQKLADIVLTVDEKSRWSPEYSGPLTYRADPADLKRRPPFGDEQPNHVVFRGVALRGDLKQSIKVDSVATLAWNLAMSSPVRVVVNVDELSDATTGGQAWDRGGDTKSSVGALYRKGRAVGLSVVAGTQLPQCLPREAFALSETIGLFRMDARELAYLVNYRVIDEELAATVRGLQRGDWVLYRKGAGGWDRKIYRF